MRDRRDIVNVGAGFAIKPFLETTVDDFDRSIAGNAYVFSSPFPPFPNRPSNPTAYLLTYLPN